MPAVKLPRLVVGDDHALIVNGVRTLLAPYYEIAGTASDGRQLLELVLRLRPEIVVLDVSMPMLNGIEAAARIHHELPETKLIFLSMHSNPMYLRKALDAGASAYVLKTGVMEELLEAIKFGLSGVRYISPGLSAVGLESSDTDRAERDLTQRQREILQLVVEGRASKEIAYLLQISAKTVDFHRTRIMAKMGARSVAEMVRIAIDEGLATSGR